MQYYTWSQVVMNNYAIIFRKEIYLHYALPPPPPCKSDNWILRKLDSEILYVKNASIGATALQNFITMNSMTCFVYVWWDIFSTIGKKREKDVQNRGEVLRGQRAPSPPFPHPPWSLCGPVGQMIKEGKFTYSHCTLLSPDPSYNQSFSFIQYWKQKLRQIKVKKDGISSKIKGTVWPARLDRPDTIERREIIL